MQLTERTQVRTTIWTIIALIIAVASFCVSYYSINNRVSWIEKNTDRLVSLDLDKRVAEAEDHVDRLMSLDLHARLSRIENDISWIRYNLEKTNEKK